MLMGHITSAGSTMQDDPPGMTALSLRPFHTPPTSAISSLKGIPKGNSKLPGFSTWPETEKIDGAARIHGPQTREPRGPFAHDGGHRGEALRVVDGGRFAEQAEIRRKRRFEARLAGLALQGFEQRGLLAADVGAGADEHVQVEIDAAAQECSCRAAPPHRLRPARLRSAEWARRETRREYSCIPRWPSWRSRRWPCPRSPSAGCSAECRGHGRCRARIRPNCTRHTSAPARCAA